MKHSYLVPISCMTPFLWGHLALAQTETSSSVSNPSPAKASSHSLEGDWYLNSMDSLMAGFQQASIKRSGTGYRARMYGKDWDLKSEDKIWVGLSPATADEIHKSVMPTNPFAVQWPRAQAVEAARQGAFQHRLLVGLRASGQEIGEKHELFGKPFVYNGRKVEIHNFSMAPVNVWERKPNLKADYGWSEYVLARKGYVDFPFRSLFKNEIFYYAAKDVRKLKNQPLLWYSSLSPGVFVGDKKTGHQYLCISSLGRPGFTPLQAMNILKKNIETLFPDGARGYVRGFKGDSVVEKGNTFDLRVKALSTHAGKVVRFNPRVYVNKVGPTEFTFLALKGHPLEGTAQHGIFADSSGELFLYQQGRGISEETWLSIGLTYANAPFLWKRMADGLKQKLATDAATMWRKPR